MEEIVASQSLVLVGEESIFLRASGGPATKSPYECTPRSATVRVLGDFHPHLFGFRF